jgi:secreted Zn-dependent insulinase-like peptidase
MIEHMEDVIGLLFRYITLLQNSGTPKWIFDEVNLISDYVFLIIVCTWYQDKLFKYGKQAAAQKQSS